MSAITIIVGRCESGGVMILFTGIVGLLMIGGLMMGPVDPDVDLTELAEADETSEDEAFEEQSKAQIGGMPSSDILSGTDFNDVIDALEGDDQVHGYAGADDLSGGIGEDDIHGGDGNDTLSGQSGEDTLHGGFGNDQIEGGDHADQLWGDIGDDTLSGDQGNDTLTGSAGTDMLMGDDGNDGLHGNDGNDHLDGGAGEDVLFGGNGSDTLEGGSDAARDFLNGGRGDDLLVAKEADVLTGGEGSDTFAIDTSAGAFEQSAQIIDFSTEEDQIEITLSEEDYAQDEKDIRIETNDDGSSVVYLNNEEVVVVKSDTPLLLKDILITKDPDVDLTGSEDASGMPEDQAQEETPKTRIAATPASDIRSSVDLDEARAASEGSQQIEENAGADHLSDSNNKDDLKGADGNDQIPSDAGERSDIFAIDPPVGFFEPSVQTAESFIPSAQNAGLFEPIAQVTDVSISDDQAEIMPDKKPISGCW